MEAQQPDGQMRKLFSLFYGCSIGFFLWALSPTVLSVSEPWDSERRVYSIVIIVAGIPVGLIGFRSLVAGYLGVWSGQIAALLVLPSFQKGWMILGIISTGAGSLLLFFGEAIALGIRSFLGRRRAA